MRFYFSVVCLRLSASISGGYSDSLIRFENDSPLQWNNGLSKRTAHLWFWVHIVRAATLLYCGCCHALGYNDLACELHIAKILTFHCHYDRCHKITNRNICQYITIILLQLCHTNSAILSRVIMTSNNYS